MINLPISTAWVNSFSPNRNVFNKPTTPLGNGFPYQGGPNAFLGNDFRYQGGPNAFLGNDFRYQGGSNAFLGNDFRYQGASNASWGNDFRYQGGPNAPWGNDFRYQGGPNAPWGNDFRYLCEPPIVTPPPLRTPEGVNAIASNKDFKTLTTALEAAGLVPELKEIETKKGPITVLAPTEAAFQKLDPKLREALFKRENLPFLQEILSYHASDMPFPLNQQAGKTRFNSLLPNKNDNTGISSSPDGRFSLVNGAQKIQGSSPIQAPNGSTIIPVDQVLIPPGFDVDALNADKTNAVSFLKTNKNSSTLFTAIGAADLGGAVGNLEGGQPITILAPSEAAFKKLDPKLLTALLKPENKGVLQEILKYHVSATKSEQGTFNSLLDDINDKVGISTSPDGQTVIVSGRQVVQGANTVTTSNGSKIITIDEVLIPPSVNLSSLV